MVTPTDQDAEIRSRQECAYCRIETPVACVWADVGYPCLVDYQRLQAALAQAEAHIETLDPDFHNIDEDVHAMYVRIADLEAERIETARTFLAMLHRQEVSDLESELETAKAKAALADEMARYLRYKHLPQSSDPQGHVDEYDWLQRYNNLNP